MLILGWVRASGAECAQPGGTEEEQPLPGLQHTFLSPAVQCGFVGLGGANPRAAHAVPGSCWAAL